MNTIKSCPFSKLKETSSIFSEVENEFLKKVEKSIETSDNDNFDKILEKLANFYLEHLEKIFSEEDLEFLLKIENKEDMFTGFGNYFQIIFTDSIFQNFKFSDKQKQVLEKVLKNSFSSNPEFFPGVLGQAFLDIFLLKILQKKFPELSDKKINKIIQQNMFSGTMLKGDISTVVVKGLRYEKNLEEIFKNLEEINEEIPGYFANCPFFYVKNQKNWVYSMMKFFDEKIIPKIPENSYLFNFK